MSDKFFYSSMGSREPLRASNICCINENTTSHTCNFWLSNLSSLPEGSTLAAIPATQLGDCLFKLSGSNFFC